MDEWREGGRTLIVMYERTPGSVNHSRVHGDKVLDDIIQTKWNPYRFPPPPPVSGFCVCRERLSFFSPETHNQLKRTSVAFLPRTCETNSSIDDVYLLTDERKLIVERDIRRQIGRASSLTNIHNEVFISRD